MRTSRVFYLFLSVVQFIFFLKLVEYVRGEEIPTAGISDAGSIQNNPTEKDDLPRGMFIAPNIKRKKQRTDLGKSSNNTESDVPGNSSGRIDEAEVNNSTLKRRNQYEKEVARLCPACENNECKPTDPISAGFPIVPIIIAVLIGVAWFILFLIAWIFHTRPNLKGSGGYEEEGYGYGSPQPEYGVGTDSGRPYGDFLKPHERSFQSYTQIMHNVLDSISKLSDLYNS